MRVFEDCYDLPSNAGVPGAGFCEDERDNFAAEDWFRRRYRHWRGRSGKSYVFSVYAPQDCPAYERAVLIVANSGAPGAGGILACMDLGARPEARLCELRRQFRSRLGQMEFQIHVLAEHAGDRLSMIDDITLHAA